MKIRFYFIIKSLVARVFLLLAVFVFGACGAYAISDIADNTIPSDQSVQILYTEEQLQDLVSPSVVRIVQVVKGTAQIAPFIIDVENRTISLDGTKEPIEIDNINENIIGTGFIVSTYGYIVTNAHLVSDTTSRLAIITPYVETAIQKAKEVSGENIDGDISFDPEIFDFVINNSTFELEKEIVIIDPELQIDEAADDLSFEMSQTGMLASILYVNNDFHRGGDNLAVIKIEAKNLPAVLISNENKIAVGDKFYTFEMPSVHDFKDMSNFSNSGSYDFELKSSSVVMNKTDTNMLYTDLKLDQQASGGPSFNALGDIVGILSFKMKEGGSGDRQIHASIITNDIVKSILDKAGVVSNTGLYAECFKKGIKYINSGLCDEASNEFDAALSFGSPFVKNVNVDPYLIECYKEAELSRKPQAGISGFLSMVQNKSASLDLLDWTIVVLLALLALTLLIAIVIAINKLRKKENVAEYKPIERSRNEMVLNARRIPLSKVLPKMSKEPVRSVGSDVVISQNKKIQNRKTFSDSDVTNDQVFSSLEFFRAASDEDQKRLAKLWPNKYNNKLHESETVLLKKAAEIRTTVDKKLMDYIQSTRALGFEDKDIQQELGSAGWNKEDIKAAFDEMEKNGQSYKL